MDMAPALQTASESSTEHFDVLIVGAGISGIDAAHHLRTTRPGTSFELIESQDGFGGTWRTHTYPGIRSDSDLFTFGFKWKPWTGVPIATADAILDYLSEAIEEEGLADKIRYGTRVETASWSGKDNRWTVVARNKNGEARRITCSFLWMCQGYYRHEKGYTPEWPGMERFAGPIVHPQTWPEDLDYKGKRVVVIGSGATAATIIPAMADDCEHITMLQRSPTYFFPRPNVNELSEQLRELDVPEPWHHEIMRRKYLKEQELVRQRAIDEPEALAAELIGAARAYLGEDFDVEKHFTPGYRVWRQRLALIPDGDLFKAIRSGKASVVTDHIESFTENGIALKSGEHLDADIVVTATGFHLCALGDVEFEIDGEPLDFSRTWAHRGMMFSGVPNLAWVFGYLRTSWTMRADLVSEFVCRLLAHMDARGAASVTPTLRPEDEGMAERPFIDPENFNAGYIVRNQHVMPKQGDHLPWLMTQDYYVDRDEIPAADLEDGTLVYR